MTEPRIIWIDLETGGVDETVHQITQIGAIATAGPPEFKELSVFERKVELSDGHWTKEALDVQAYDMKTWGEEAIPITTAIRDLIEWVGPFTHSRVSKRTGRPYRVAHMGGHNVEFDGRFLRATSGRLKTWLPLTNWTGGQFDTLTAAKWWFMMKGEFPETFKLEALCEMFGIKLKAHDALADVEATVKLARIFAGGKESG